MPQEELVATAARGPVRGWGRSLPGGRRPLLSVGGRGVARNSSEEHAPAAVLRTSWERRTLTLLIGPVSWEMRCHRAPQVGEPRATAQVRPGRGRGRGRGLASKGTARARPAANQRDG